MSVSNSIEVWTGIEGYANREVSSHGRIRSWIGNRGMPNIKRETPVIVKQFPDKRGYMQVNLSSNGKARRFFVHRLVVQAFRGPAQEGQNQIRHLDGNPSNNELSNIVWGNSIENYGDRIRHGTGNEGERSHHAKLTQNKVDDLRLRYKSGEKVSKMAVEFGVSEPTIRRAINFISWASAPRATWGG